MEENDCFSKFFIKSEWDELTISQRLTVKIMFIDYLVRRSKAKDDEEIEKPAYLVRYDQRRAKVMEARQKELAKHGNRREEGKTAKSDVEDNLLRGFTELEIAESRKDILPLMKLVDELKQEFDSSDSDLSESGMYKRKLRPRRNRRRVNYEEVDELEFDDFIYCDTCDAYAIDYCPIHGPLLVIPDRSVTEIPPGSMRAEMTCPKELEIAPSNIPGAGLGVFTRIHMPKNVRFGPYEGVITSKPKPGGYAWQVVGTMKTRTHLLDAVDPDKSNWLRYVNCARRYADQNMTTFQYHGKLYYRTIDNIPPNTELLIFYGVEYAGLLGIDVASYGDEDVSSEEDDEIISCKHCGETTTAEDYDEAHLKFCLGQQGDIQRHLLHRHRTMDGNEFECDACNRTFAKIHLLRAHTRLHRRNSEPSATADRAVVGPSTESHTDDVKANKKTFKCYICQKGFSSKTYLNVHKRTHTGIGVSVCRICDAKFSNKGSLANHLRTHTGEKPFKCETCHAKFTQSGHLTIHMRTHTGEKPFKCDTCDARFTQSGPLTTHMRTHTGEKPFKCDTCDARFTRSCHLTIHMRTHTGERPFKCDTCDARFTQSGPLTTHMRTHTGEKPFKCDTCDARFTQSGPLTTHMRTHTGEKPFKCDTCDARFTRSCHLTIHMRTHTGEKPFKCDTCDARFTRSCHLTIHMRTHTGERPFKCDTCDARFTRTDNLTVHMKRCQSK